MRTILLSNSNDFNHRYDDKTNRHAIRKLADFYRKNSHGQSEVTIISTDDKVQVQRKKIFLK